MANGTVTIPAFGNGSSYVKLADGTMFQWGSFAKQIPSGSAYADTVITYPVAFNSGSPIHVVMSCDEPGEPSSTQGNACIPSVYGTGVGVSTRLTQCTARVWKQGSTGTSNNPKPTFSWIAIGRWK